METKVEKHEWKINNWFMKTLFVLGSGSGVLTAIYVVVSFIKGLFSL